jgi:1-aminocyclopropane-1-carboxylate synthase
VIEVLDNHLGNDVHFLWGFSKDFGASGFRMAILYSQNLRLLQALANLNIFSGVSNPMQLIAAEILSDDEFIDAFLEDARSQLSFSYRLCTSKLEEMVVPYVPAEAGIFVYVDFSSLLPSQSFEGEDEFATLIQDVARIVLTPGRSQRDCKPGMFRLCYAWVTSDVLQLAMERLSYTVLQIRRHGWEDLMINSWQDEVTKVRSVLLALFLQLIFKTSLYYDKVNSSLLH